MTNEEQFDEDFTWDEVERETTKYEKQLRNFTIFMFLLGASLFCWGGYLIWKYLL